MKKTFYGFINFELSRTNVEQDFDFMGLALAQARLAQAAGEVPVGAVVVDESGDILAQAHNAPISLSDPTAHAEVLALRRAAAQVGNYRLPGATLYVTIEPCLMCVGAIIQARLKRLVFGAADPKAGACKSLYRIPRISGLTTVLRSPAASEKPSAGNFCKNFSRSGGEAICKARPARHLLLATDY